MAVFQNGLLGPHVVHRVGLDSNYVIETAPIPLPLMEGKTARAEISMKGDHVIWKLANQVNQRVLVFPLFLIQEVYNTPYRGHRDTMLSDRGEVFVKSFEFKDWTLVGVILLQKVELLSTYSQILPWGKRTNVL